MRVDGVFRQMRLLASHGLPAIGVALLLLMSAQPAWAQGSRFALIVQGASGEEQYATLHRKWVDSLATVLRDKYRYDAAHLVILAEQPKADEQRSTAVALRAVTADLAKRMTASDQLVVVLIGHGSAQGTDVKFNLIGPDLGVTEWADLLKPIPGRLSIVDTTSASFPYLAALAGPGRVVITATSAASQRYHTVFPEGFVQAFADSAADLDKNGRVSLLEAFTFASRVVKENYDRSGTMATETAMIDDDGDGKGRLATATGPDGSVAALTYLDAVVVATSSDPEMQKLLLQQQQLTEQIDDLRRRRTMLPADEFDKQLEKLITDLAVVSRKIRTGN